MRLAAGQVWPVVADRSHGPGEDVGRQGSRKSETSHASDAADEKDRHQRPAAGVRPRITRQDHYYAAGRGAAGGAAPSHRRATSRPEIQVESHSTPAAYPPTTSLKECTPRYSRLSPMATISTAAPSTMVICALRPCVH